MVNSTASAGEVFEFRADSVFVSFESCMSLAQHPARDSRGGVGVGEGGAASCSLKVMLRGLLALLFLLLLHGSYFFLFRKDSEMQVMLITYAVYRYIL